MFKKIQHGTVILGLLLPIITVTANASSSYANCRSSEKIVQGKTTAPLCDVSFTGAIPAFACATADTTPPILGTYTVTNNTPVTIALGTPILVINDSQPSGDTFISANTCGSTLAPGASCLITVEITVNTPLNRTLQIPVNSRQGKLVSPVITPTGTCTIVTPTPPSPALTCPLGATSSFGVLAGSAISNASGSTVINGNLGITPSGYSSVTGFTFSSIPGPGVVNGTTYFADATAVTAQNDLTKLYLCLAALPCTHILTDVSVNQTLLAYNPGGVNVYCSPGSTINIDSGATLTLDGAGNANTVFVFQAGSALNVTNANIAITDGTSAANVFWQVTSSATLSPGGATETFYGTIVALTTISMSAGGGTPAVMMNGRALARNGAVTFNDDTVTVP